MQEQIIPVRISFNKQKSAKDFMFRISELSFAPTATLYIGEKSNTYKQINVYFDYGFFEQDNLRCYDAAQFIDIFNKIPCYIYDTSSYYNVINSDKEYSLYKSNDEYFIKESNRVCNKFKLNISEEKDLLSEKFAYKSSSNKVICIHTDRIIYSVFIDRSSYLYDKVYDNYPYKLIKEDGNYFISEV